MKAVLGLLALAVACAAPGSAAAQAVPAAPPQAVSAAPATPAAAPESLGYGEGTATADIDSLPVFEIKKKGWLAVGEVVGLNLLIWSYDRFIRESGTNPGFRIGVHSWDENIHNGFEWDDNSFATNQFAHPYHGNLYFNAARSNGYDFWGSLPFAFGGSFMWEYFMETHHPAINDWVATSMGGAALGESLHRLSAMVWDNTDSGGSRVWRELGGFFVNPMGGLNRIISGEAFSVHANPADRYPSKLRFRFNAGLRTVGDNRVWESDTTRVYMELDFGYGDPFNGDNEKPFDSFDISADLTFKDKTTLGRVQAKGLLFLSELHRSDRAVHYLGAYQHFDYFNNWAYEIGGQSISASYLSQIGLGETSLHTELHALGVILGGTKSDYESFTGRSYDYGPGLGFKFLVSLARRGRPFFTLAHSDTWIHVVNGNNADHFVTGTLARLDLPIRQYLGVGLEYRLYNAKRRYDDFLDVSQRSPEYRIYFSWID